MTLNSSIRITLIMVMSANGTIAQQEVENSFEWNSPEDRQQFLDRIRSIGTVIMGKNTYKSIGQRPYEGLDFYVLTSQKEQFESHERVIFLEPDPIKVCETLASRGIKKAALLGGSKTNSLFFRERLVDEIYLTIEPVLMPTGMHLVETLTDPIRLKLDEVKTLANGHTLLLHYLVE